ncbi:MAG: cell division protein ZapA [Dysgonamonadaceae bacterium]|jgi:hypothetical protein|nr:cell division protein ZapA [Dysgonamonadaceae bacterium]
MNNIPDENEKFRINLKIAGKRYPMWCLRKEKVEKIHRDAEQSINDKLLRYGARYPKKDIYDHMVMSAIHISSENESRKKNQDKSEVFETLQKLASEIDEFLKENN